MREYLPWCRWLRGPRVGELTPPTFPGTRGQPLPPRSLLPAAFFVTCLTALWPRGSPFWLLIRII